MIIINRYRVASISKDNGYGHSVIGKLKETKVKKNLYYEIKDRILEETTDGNRVIRNKRKTKVFGLYSDKNVRDQLIELLKERVNLHKDKFISPTLYHELRGLEVKRNGKVEHSDLTHDDQIFSYLMAMYVWYEGKNLRETFGIEKTTIKTEESVDDIVSLEGAEDFGDITQEILYITRDGEDKVANDIKDMQRAKGMMYNEFIERQRAKENKMLKQFLMHDKSAREAYARYYNISVDSIAVDQEDIMGKDGSLPDSVFTDFYKDYDEIGYNSAYSNFSPNIDRNGILMAKDDEIH